MALGIRRRLDGREIILLALQPPLKINDFSRSCFDSRFQFSHPLDCLSFEALAIGFRAAAVFNERGRGLAKRLSLLARHSEQNRELLC